MDADVAAAIVLEMMHPAWREQDDALFRKLTRTRLMGYIAGALEAVLRRRGVPVKDLAATRHAALKIIVSRRPDLAGDWCLLADDGEFQDGAVAGSKAARQFLAPDQADGFD